MEFSGDWEKTVPILPRPLRKPSHKLRMGYLTGDDTGNSPLDGGAAWRGEKPPEGKL